MQTRTLLGFRLRPADLAGAPFAFCRPNRTSALAERAAQRLERDFDVVGTTERMPEFMRALAARTGWAPQPRWLRDPRSAAEARNAAAWDGEFEQARRIRTDSSRFERIRADSNGFSHRP